MTQLQLSRNFALPIDAVTTAIGVIGIRGSGKTHTASVVAELLTRLQQQINDLVTKLDLVAQKVGKK